MREKLNVICKNQTWRLVQLPRGKKAVGCKWVFIMKQNPDGTVDKLKARPVAKGYAQLTILKHFFCCQT